MKYTYQENKFQLSGIENINESLSTHYIIYKIINNINGKYYIGQHKTNNIYDDYMGSGILISKAENKYKLSSFTKIILFDYDNFNDMNNKEAELVQLSNCYPYDLSSYNIQLGGINGKKNDFTKQLLSQAQHKYQESLTSEEKEKFSQKQSDIWNNKSDEEKNKIIQKCRDASTGKNNPMYGKNWQDYSTPEKIALHRQHMRIVTSGENNPMYGKDWRQNKTEEELKEIKIKQFNNTPKGKNHPQYGTKLLYDLNNKIHFIKEQDINQYLKLGWKLSKLEYKKLSKNKNHVTYGRKWIFCKETNDRKLVKQEDLNRYLNSGYILGNGKGKLNK